jgi:hypothetical protein
VRGKLVAGKVPFDSKTLFAVLVEDQRSRRPQDVEAVKARGVLFDVNGRRNELFVDPFRQLRIAVGLGFQPSAAASSGRGAEIEQHRTMFFLGFAECRINILDPVDRHKTSSRLRQHI